MKSERYWAILTIHILSMIPTSIRTLKRTIIRRVWGNILYWVGIILLIILAAIIISRIIW